MAAPDRHRAGAARRGALTHRRTGPPTMATALARPPGPVDEIGDDERFRVHSRMEIAGLLRAMAARELVTVQFGGANDFLVTAVLGVDLDAGVVVLDYGADEAAMQRLLRSERLRFSPRSSTTCACVPGERRTEGRLRRRSRIRRRAAGGDDADAAPRRVPAQDPDGSTADVPRSARQRRRDRRDPRARHLRRGRRPHRLRQGRAGRNRHRVDGLPHRVAEGSARSPATSR